jgi:TetR/AcrR family transcriptional regulator
MADLEAIPPRGGRLRRARVARILEAAVEIFAAKGFEGTTTTDIAERADLPKANVHYYFGTKEKIYRAVLDDILDIWLDEADHWITRERTPREALEGYIRSKIALSRKKPEASRIYANELLCGAAHLTQYLNFDLRQRVQTLSSVVTEWIARGEIRPIDPVHLLFCIWAMTQTYADFSVQISAVLGKKSLDPSVFDVAAQTICALVVDSLILKNSEPKL